jgi:multicomponent Na+:H+ antiporter subunit A
MAVARTVIAALALVGVIGFTLSIWLLLLGAPDVALTLLLVEILTVVVAVPVLRRRPDLLPRAQHRAGTALAAGAAVLLGLAAGAGVWLMTGRTARSPAADYLLAEAEVATGGSNVVNTVLVDFRGLDTLGEIGVLVAAAVGLLALLGSLPDRRLRWFAPAELGVVTAGARVVVPSLVVAAALLFWRGHDQPGGGFIAGLVCGLALVLAQLVGWNVRLPRAGALLAVGLGIATVTGLLGLGVAGAFLEPIKVAVPLLDDGLTTSLLFDLGVLLVVLGLVRTAVARLEASADLGHDTAPEPAEVPDPAGQPSAEPAQQRQVV